jgi:hypothetical protein
MDTHGEALAKERGWKVRRFLPDWKTHGPAAGPRRNQAMLDAGADGAIVLRLDDSRGSADMARRATDEIDLLDMVFPRSAAGKVFNVGTGTWE